MSIVRELKELAEDNEMGGSFIARLVANAQRDHYAKMIEAGFSEDDDVDTIVLNHPEMAIKL